MYRELLKSKIHRAKITEANLFYDGSFTIDEAILDEAEILPYEKIAVVNINNGERFETYAIPGKRGSRIFCLNGAAARKGSVGDEVIVMSYVYLEPNEIENHKPIIILVDKNNNIIDKTNTIKANTKMIRN